MSIASYIKSVWADRAVQYPRRYRDQNNNQYTFTPDEGTVSNPGTYVTAARMNNLESGVEAVTNEVITHMADYVRQPGYGTTGGSANTYTLTLAPALSAYAAGVCVAVKIHAANTGSSTININGLGSKVIKDSKGNNLTSGKLILNGVYTMRYDGTNFILQGEGGSGNATASDLLSGKTASTDAGDITGTMPNRSGDTACLSSSVSGTTLKLLASNGYRDGVDDNVTITDADFIASNIKNGMNIFGVTGNYEAKRYATGSVTNVSSLTINGLAFRPSYIVFWRTNVDATKYDDVHVIRDAGFPYSTSWTIYHVWQYNQSNNNYGGNALNENCITNDGCLNASLNWAPANISWVAFE